MDDPSAAASLGDNDQQEDGSMEDGGRDVTAVNGKGGGLRLGPKDSLFVQQMSGKGCEAKTCSKTKHVLWGANVHQNCSVLVGTAAALERRRPRNDRYGLLQVHQGA